MSETYDIAELMARALAGLYYDRALAGTLRGVLWREDFIQEQWPEFKGDADRMRTIIEHYTTVRIPHKGRVS